MPWSGATVAPVAWAQVSPVREPGTFDVDFELRFREAYPMILSSDRPLLMQSTLSEGAP